MPNLLTIDDLSNAAIEAILQKASYYKTQLLAHHQKSQHLQNRVVTNLFFEPSTRTLNSFQLAESFQDMVTLAPHLASSALTKGESIYDTLLTMQAMGSELFVIRHKDDDLLNQIEQWQLQAPVINAGCGQTAHPTQALIDLNVILSRFDALDDVVVAIVGDIKHSRVAQSQIKLLTQWGVKNIRTVGPASLQNASPHTSVTHYDNLQQGLNGADVVIRLRLQKERLGEQLALDMDDFVQSFCITPKTITYAKNDAIVLHPGPCIVGEDFSTEFMTHPQNMILSQVAVSVPTRMACIDFALNCL